MKFSINVYSHTPTSSSYIGGGISAYSFISSKEVLAENTATARATQLEATKTKKEAEGQLASLKDEFAIHQGACDKTLAALKAN